MNKVFLVGAGCGRGQMTLRGAELLKECDCVVYDSLIDGNLLGLCKPSCEKIFAGKRAGAHALAQEEICGLLVACGRKYPLTVRLKGGDPYVFGRGGEEMLALREAGIYAESVAGVTSAVAAAEEAGIPVTHRGISRGFHVLTAHTAEGTADFKKLAGEEDTLVFLMGKACAAEIQNGLCAGGMDQDMPAAVISSAGTSDFCVKRTTLSRLAETAESLPPPMVILVGRVCALDTRAGSDLKTGFQSSAADTKERGGGGSALQNGAENCAREDVFSSCREKRDGIVVTGTESHIGRVLAKMKEAGLSACGLPTLDMYPKDLRAFFEKMSAFSMLVFTSVNGVEVFFSEFFRRKKDIRCLSDKKFAVIGSGTASALERRGIFADLMPETFTGRALAEKIHETGIPKEKVALLRSASGGNALKKVGVQFDVYDTVARPHWEEGADEILRGAAYVTFSSAGGVRAFFEKRALPPRALPVAIGEETADELKKRGLNPVIAEVSDAGGLIRAVFAAKETSK